MSKDPLASVIVITYNNADTVEECLLSILNQSYPVKEIIAVYDEGSVDRTYDVLCRLLEDHKGTFRIISTPHVGRSKARNIGWRCSKGSVFLFADADDVYNRDYLEKAIPEIDSDLTMGGLCLTGASLVKQKGVIAGYFDAYSKIQQKRINLGLFRPSWAWVYRREAIERVGGYDELLDQAEDRDLCIRVKALGYRIGLIPGINWLHRRPSKLTVHLKKSYIASKKRIQFIARYKLWGEMLRAILPFLTLMAILILSFLYTPLLAVVLACVSSLIVMRALETGRLVWRTVERKRNVLLYSLLSFIFYSFSAAGYTYGFLKYLAKGKV